MYFDNYLVSEAVMLDVTVTSKKQLFQMMSEKLVGLPELKALNLPARDVVNAILERERLGSTGVGSGVALPHARLPGLDKVHAVFARLTDPIDYEAIDDAPVDLVVLLVAPEEAGGEHLRALAQFSRRLRREETRERLRAAPDSQALYISMIQRANAA